MGTPPDLTLRIRPTPDDVNWIVRRHGAFHCRELGFDKSFEDYVANPLREAIERTSAGDRIWIAERGGERVGCVAVVERGQNAAQLRWFLVEPDARRLGIGSELLQSAVRFARERGRDRMILWTVRGLTDAARLYQRQGFRRTLVRPGHEWGVDVIQERYELELGERTRVMDRKEMEGFARGWGRVADRYAEELFDELDRKPFDRELLARFADRVVGGAIVGDVGCGPGHVSKFLAARGLRMQGIDLCPEMVAKARELVPEAEFRVGNMLALDLSDGAWGGAIAFYSLINVIREDAGAVLAEIARVLKDGAPLAVAVHRGKDVLREDEVFGQALSMAATLYEPDELEGLVRTAGFSDIEVHCRTPSESEYPSERVYILARRTL